MTETAITGAATTETATTGTEDGRRLRRDRNRDAVVSALLDLYGEGNLDPSTDEVAARSGVSARSLFRYFDDVDDLCRAAIDRQQREVGHLFAVDATPADPFDRRVQAVVRQRADLFDTIESAATVVRLRAPFQRVVQENLTRNRAVLRTHLADLFAVELAAMPAATGASRLAAADVVASFESWRLLRGDQAIDREAAMTAMADTLTLLFTA